jgi:hypothetical protein
MDKLLYNSENSQLSISLFGKNFNIVLRFSRVDESNMIPCFRTNMKSCLVPQSQHHIWLAKYFQFHREKKVCFLCTALPKRRLAFDDSAASGSIFGESPWCESVAARAVLLHGNSIFCLLQFRISESISFNIHCWGTAHNRFGWSLPTSFWCPDAYLFVQPKDITGNLRWKLLKCT